MYNMSAHQLPQYYQPQQVPSTAWTTSVTWYMHHKLACTKILQNFLLIQVFVIILIYYITKQSHLNAFVKFSQDYFLNVIKWIEKLHSDFVILHQIR